MGTQTSIHMELAELWTVETVRSEERPPGLEHPGDLGQEPVLKLHGGNVVQHDERRRCTECVVGEGEPGRVSMDDLDVRAGKPFGELRRQDGIDLDGCQLAHLLP